MLEDGFDEDYELGDATSSEELSKSTDKHHAPTIERSQYFRHLLDLQRESIKAPRAPELLAHFVARVFG